MKNQKLLMYITIGAVALIAISWLWKRRPAFLGGKRARKRLKRDLDTYALDTDSEARELASDALAKIAMQQDEDDYDEEYDYGY